MHRFVWDLHEARPPVRSFRYTIAAVRRDGTPAVPLGPFVLPGRYTVTLEAGGRRVTQPLEVRLDPRLDVGLPDLEAQLALTREIESLLRLAWSAHDEAQAALKAGRRSLEPATADSIAAIATRGDASLSGLAGSLTQLYGSVQAADAAPTQGQREAFAACRLRVAGLVERWKRLSAALVPGGGSAPRPPVPSGSNRKEDR